MRKSPRFTTIFFSRTRSFARALAGAQAAGGSGELWTCRLTRQTEDAETDDAIFECALAELLAAGVAADMRPLVQKFQDDPAAFAAAFTLLPPKVQEELGGKFLPAGDAARDDGLRHAQLSDAGVGARRIHEARQLLRAR